MVIVKLTPQEAHALAADLAEMAEHPRAYEVRIGFDDGDGVKTKMNSYSWGQGRGVVERDDARPKAPSIL